MDIARLSTVLSQNKLASSVTMGMMKKALDQIEKNGETIAEMIQQTAVTQPEGRIDLKI